MVNTEKEIKDSTILGLRQAKALGKEVEVISTLITLLKAESGMDIKTAWEMALNEIK